MRHITSILFFLLSNSFYSQNPEWMNLDKELIQGLVTIDKDSTHLIEKYFEAGTNVEFSNLGFGWTGKSVYNAGGYISIKAELFYFHDSLVSFEIRADLPKEDDEEKKIKSEYLKWYDGYFVLDNQGDLVPYTYKPEILCSPLDDIDDSLKNVKLNDTFSSFMKPIPGHYYYWRGGFNSRVSSDRLLFMENSDSLNYKQLAFLTYSKDPVTRFFAIEEIKRRKYTKTRCTKQDLAWIEKCFDEVPRIKTLRGCMGGYEKSRKLVSRFSKMTRKQLFYKF